MHTANRIETNSYYSSKRAQIVERTTRIYGVYAVFANDESSHRKHGTRSNAARRKTHHEQVGVSDDTAERDRRNDY